LRASENLPFPNLGQYCLVWYWHIITIITIIITMETRIELFGEFLGLPSKDVVENVPQIKKILYGPRTDTSGFQPTYHYNDNDFEGCPNGLEIPYSFDILRDEFTKACFDPETPEEAVSGSWVRISTVTNPFVLSLFAQCQNKVQFDKQNTGTPMSHLAFCQPQVNSRPMVDYGRVDQTVFEQNMKDLYTREDGLLPVTLGLAKDCDCFSSTGFTVLPYVPFSVQGQDKSKLQILPVDVPEGSAFSGSYDKVAVKLSMEDVQKCWKILVSNDITIHKLLPESITKCSTEVQVVASVSILLNGLYLRYDGLSTTTCWEKLYQRLMKDLTPTAEDLEIQSPCDLCHVTFILFDLVIQDCSLGVVDGVLRTVVARMVSTWQRQKGVNSLPTALKYPFSKYHSTALKMVSKPISVDIINVETRETLDAKHGELLRDRSHQINENANAAAPRGIMENLAALVEKYIRRDLKGLDFSSELKKSFVMKQLQESRKRAILHLRNAPDVHTCVDQINNWNDCLMTKEMTKNMHNLLTHFPGKAHFGTNLFCSVAMMCLNPKASAVVYTFISLNGHSPKQNSSSFKVSFRKEKKRAPCPRSHNFFVHYVIPGIFLFLFKESQSEHSTRVTV
jgi:hypothetical protein